MNQDQINSALRSLLKIIGSALAAHGLAQAASIVNGEDCIGVVLAVAGLVWSHFSHAPDAPPPPAAKLPGPKIMMLAGMLTLLLGVAACNTAQQTVAYKTIASVEQAATMSYDGYCGLVIQHSLPTNGVPAASAAFQHFQNSARLATLLAMNNTNALAPAALGAEEAQLLSLINSFESASRTGNQPK